MIYLLIGQAVLLAWIIGELKEVNENMRREFMLLREVFSEIIPAVVEFREYASTRRTR
jgi:hypothetical protein